LHKPTAILLPGHRRRHPANGEHTSKELNSEVFWRKVVALAIQRL
jgi:hypothetical protein